LIRNTKTDLPDLFGKLSIFVYKVGYSLAASTSRFSGYFFGETYSRTEYQNVVFVISIFNGNSTYLTSHPWNYLRLL